MIINNLFLYIKRCYYINKHRLFLERLKIKANNAQIFYNVGFYFHPSSECRIGDNFIFTSGRSTNPLVGNIEGSIRVEKNAKLIIGNNIGMSSSFIWATKGIQIGNNVKIGAGTMIIDSDMHSLNYLERRSLMDKELAVKKEITIGDDVLIGSRAMILKGVSIGQHSIVGAGAVVSKDVPPDTIVAGNPARIIKTN